MKKQFSKLLAVGLLLLFSTWNANGDNVTWSLVSAITPSSTSGTGYTASSQNNTLTTPQTTDYTAKKIDGTTGAQRVRGTYTSSSLPTAYNANSYLEYVLTAASGYNLTVSGVSMDVGQSGTTSVRAAFAYSVNDFTNSYWLGGYTNSAPIVNPALIRYDNATAVPYLKALSFTSFNGSSTVLVPEGSSLKVRVYPWLSAAATSKYFVSSNVVFTFTAATACTTPTTYSVSADAASIANGSSTNITLSGSQSGVTYQLYKNGTAEGSPVSGTGSSLSWTVSPTASATYTVKTVANDATYCETQMSNSGVVTVVQNYPVVDLTSASGTSNQTPTINNAITAITYSLAAGNATTASVTWTGTADANTPPTGISVNFTTPTLTISGTPTVVGSYGYTVTTDGTPAATATGTINASIYTVGDYKSVASANWGVPSTWNKWSGSAWVASSDFPNATTANVYIEGGFTVNNEASTRSVKNLYISGSSNLTSSNKVNTPIYLKIYGATVSVESGSRIGNPAIGNDADGISFDVFSSNLIITGNGGTINLSRIRTNTASTTVTIDNNVTLNYHGSTNGGNAAGYYTFAGDNNTLTINAGKTLTFAPWSCYMSTGVSHSVASTFSQTFNVNGTLTFTDGLVSGNSTANGWAGHANNYLNLGVSGKTVNLNIGSVGVLNVSEFYPNGTKADNTFGAGDVVNISIAAGGIINVSKIADFRNPAQLITGEGTFNLLAGAVLKVGNANGITTTGASGAVQSATRTFPSLAEYQYESSVAQSTGDALPRNISKLVINNPSGVTLSTSTTVGETLLLTVGTLINSANNLTLGSGATIVKSAGALNAAPTFGTSVNLTYSGTSTKGNEFPVTDIINTLITNTTADIALTDNRTIPTLNIGTGSSVSVTAAKQLTVSTNLTNNGTINLLSDATGTATILTPAIISGTGTATVQQYLTTGRNWYVCSPVASAKSSVFTPSNTVTKLNWYDEITETWIPIIDDTTTLAVAKGYVANLPINNAVSFTGVLNNGLITPTLSNTPGLYSGFNLIGNPYPSYLNVMTAIANANASSTVMEPTVWYRTKGTSNYSFETVNTQSGVGTDNAGTGMVTGYIPPMQAFWIHVISTVTPPPVFSSSKFKVPTEDAPFVFTFDNSMRSHAFNVPVGTGTIPTTLLKAPSVQQLLRLQVSNGTNNDEAVIYFNQNAANSLDAYDSKKMTNANAAIPEIYTVVGGEKLVINGLNSIPLNTELPLGFTTGQSNSFTIKATQFSNFDANTKVILKDKLLGTEQDLTAAAYTFTSDAATSTDRFSVVFKTVGVATSASNVDENQSVLVYRNAANQIAVQLQGAISSDAMVSVYNGLGQKLDSKQLTSTSMVIGKQFTSGVYVVTVNNGGKTVTRKVTVN